jgi:hypothetical protein
MSFGGLFGGAFVCHLEVRLEAHCGLEDLRHGRQCIIILYQSAIQYTYNTYNSYDVYV